MTDAQKLQVIDSIVAQAIEYDPKSENKGAFFEGLLTAIFAVLVIEEGENNDRYVLPKV